MMKHALHCLILFLLSFPFLLDAQIRFADSSSVLFHPTVNSGVAMGIADMNGDGLDDIVRLDQTDHLTIDYQSDTASQFTGATYNRLFGGQWSLCIADVNQDGINDIFSGGAYNGLTLLIADTTHQTYLSSTYTSPMIFLQGANFVDINGDGLADIFACHDDGLSITLRNTGDGLFTFDPSLIDSSSPVPSDNSGNYASIWTDFDNDHDLDLYLSKCRNGVEDPHDGRRLNLLFRNDGAGQWTEIADSVGLQPKAQSWSADFADIDNDGDMDCFIVNHDSISTLLIQDTSGYFRSINESSGINEIFDSSQELIQCKFADFDNDGFVDLLVTNTEEEHFLLHNQRDRTFINIGDSIPSPNRVHTASVGDLNNDGFLDIMAGFARSINIPTDTPDRLFLNAGNAHHFLKILLKGTSSNINGIGARLECYGPWGIQIREVRSGEGYGIMNSFTQHFGLGQATTIDSLIIRWPSGVIDRILAPGSDQTIFLTEGETCNITLDFAVEADEFRLQFTPLAAMDSIVGLWTFGDGQDTLASQPTHQYDSVGTYEVCLEIQLECGLPQQICKLLTVSCIPPTGEFSTDADELMVQFTPMDTDGLSFLWTFGDDSDSSQLSSPIHQYTDAGTYEVCLIISDNCDTTSHCQFVEVTCTASVADFSATTDSLAVTFADLSSPGTVAWAWSFGDGTVSDEAELIHLYSSPGRYEVCLKTTNTCGQESALSCQMLSIGCEVPEALFSILSNELTQSFQDSSNHSPDTWLWTFGDGNQSTAQNPVHTYSSTGTYEVCLTTSNACGSSQQCQSVIVINTHSFFPSEQTGPYQLFPNPAQSSTRLSWKNADQRPLAIILYHSSGQMLGRFPPVGNTLQTDLNLLIYPAGSYHLAIQSKENQWQFLPLILF